MTRPPSHSSAPNRILTNRCYAGSPLLFRGVLRILPVAVMETRSATATQSGLTARLRLMLGGSSEASLTRRLAGTIFQIGFQPLQLILAQRAQAVLLDVHHVHETDEVNAIMVETIPALAFGVFSEAVEIGFAIVAGDIMFAGHVKNLLGFYGLHQLVNGVEFICAGQMGKIARMQDKIRRDRHRVDARNRLLERANHVLVDRFLVEADVRVADLHKTKTPLFDHAVRIRCARPPGQKRRAEHSAGDGPKHPRSGPSHARQKPPAVNAVVFGFLVGVDGIRRQANFFNKFGILFFVVVLHKFLTCSILQTARGGDLFPEN